MWLIARGAMADVAGGPQPTVAHRFYHVPASNTAVGHLILENACSMTINVALAGAGAFGIKHLDGHRATSTASRSSRSSAASSSKTQEVAAQVRHRARRAPTSPRAWRCDDVDAVILCTPTQMHAAQAIACLKAGKHVQVEIPLCDSARRRPRPWSRCRSRPAWSRCAATRGASTRATSGCASGSSPASSTIQQMDVQTYFFRRTNMNALGQPRSWTDHLLWHHAAHTVDLFAYQTRQPRS